MWKFLSGLPIYVSVGLIVLGILGIIFVVVRGKIKARFGNKEIDIGKDSQGNALPSPVSVVLSVRKYSCGDCILMLMGRRENYEILIRREEENILKNQMTYTEQKLSELQMIYMESISNIIQNSVKNNRVTVDEAVQYKLVDSLLKDVLINVKNEIRRSFKDNGFYEMANSDFYMYVQDRVRIVGSMIHQYFRNIYPDRGGVVSIFSILTELEEKQSFLSNLINTIYNNAQDIKKTAEEKKINIKSEFKIWIDEFTAPVKADKV